jgi:cytochrome b6-f complex iron-sulfur subunit
MNQKNNEHDQRETACRGQEKGMNRRTFVKVSGKAVAATALVYPVLSVGASQETTDEHGNKGGFTGFFRSLLGICDTAKPDPGLWVLDGSLVRVEVKKIPQLQKAYGAVYLEGQGLNAPVLIVRGEENGYVAFENRCTHFGRKLDPVLGKPLVRCCSVGHSMFDFQGKVLGGPAKGPIKVYQAEMREDELVVHLV